MSAIIHAANDASVDDAALQLKEGKLVAFPTETVYGLGADALSDQAVASIYAMKERPSFNPLIVHVRDQYLAESLGEFSLEAKKLAAHFWPGPLTLVVKRSKNCRASRLVSAGLDTIALRMPRHPIAQALLERFGGPIAAPSANPSGKLSPTRAEHVAAHLPELGYILDGGACEIGIESTVLAVDGDRVRLLRPGSITREMVEEALDQWIEVGGESIQAPGMLASHYAPSRPVRLQAAAAGANEALLAFGNHAPQGAGITLNLSPKGDLEEAATNLFAMLHALDDPRYQAIAVMPIPEEGVGVALNDRLRRAAHP